MRLGRVQAVLSLLCYSKDINNRGEPFFNGGSPLFLLLKIVYDARASQPCTFNVFGLSFDSVAFKQGVNSRVLTSETSVKYIRFFCAAALENILSKRFCSCRVKQSVLAE